MAAENPQVKQVILIRRDLRMRRGKEIAQGSHASIAFLTNRLEVNTSIKPEWIGGKHLIAAVFTDPEWDWIQGNFRKVCLVVHSEEQLLSVYHNAKGLGLVAELIEDTGLTEFHGQKTYTAAAIGPDYDDKIDVVTGHLELY